MFAILKGAGSEAVFFFWLVYQLINTFFFVNYLWCKFLGNENQWIWENKPSRVLMIIMMNDCVNISWIFIQQTWVDYCLEWGFWAFLLIHTCMKLERCGPVLISFFFSITVCVHNCTNHDDGDYQSCNTCNGYVSCGGHVLLNRDCPSTLVWDNSSTCDPKHLPS